MPFRCSICGQEHDDLPDIGSDRPYYALTLLLKSMARFRGGTQRPSIIVEPTEHPLSRDQHEGISLERAWRIVHHYLDSDDEG